MPFYGWLCSSDRKAPWITTCKIKDSNYITGFEFVKSLTPRAVRGNWGCDMYGRSGLEVFRPARGGGVCNIGCMAATE